MIQRIFVLFLLSLMTIPLFVPSASAHFNVTDGTYDVEFHVEPNDMPVAGEKSTLYFTWNKVPSEFNWDECVCMLTVTKNGIPFYYSKLPRMRSEYIFPEPGMYNLTVSGKPIELGAFKDFNLSYEYRVEPGKGPPLSNALILGALVVMFIGLSVSFIFIFKKSLKKVFPFL